MKHIRLIRLIISCIAIMFFQFLAFPQIGDTAMTAQEALTLLKEGNARFSQGKPARPNQDEARRINTADNGQKPFAAVLSCSDSRVPVELLFDRGVGDVFVVRVAGNVAGVDQVGSIEYAVEHLGVPLIVVLGHNKCGAVSAAVDGHEAHGNIRAIVEKIAPVVAQTRKANPDMPLNKLVDACILANVKHVTHYLSANSAIIKHAVESGAVKIVGANYDIRTGRVIWE